MIDVVVWQGLGDIINRFRVKLLGLEPVGLMWAPGMLDRLKVPHTYCWSSALIPKPHDWADHITISGSYLLSSGDYNPSPKLQAFLDAGLPPVYVGFGSIVLDNPRATTELMFEVSRQTGQRLLLFESPGVWKSSTLIAYPTQCTCWATRHTTGSSNTSHALSTTAVQEQPWQVLPQEDLPWSCPSSETKPSGGL